MSSPQELYEITLAGDVVYYTIGDKEGLRCRTKASRLFLYACCALLECVHNRNKSSHLGKISPEKQKTKQYFCGGLVKLSAYQSDVAQLVLFQPCQPESTDFQMDTLCFWFRG